MRARVDSGSSRAALLWSAAAGFAYGAWKERDSRDHAGFIVGAAVFSHWLLDFLVHRPDLPLIGDSFKVGLGLWNMPVAALSLETMILCGGLALYLRSTERTKSGGTSGFVLFTLALVGIQLMMFFGAPPESVRMAAAMGLGAYAVLTGIAAWVDSFRRPVETRSDPDTSRLARSRSTTEVARERPIME